MKFIKKEIAKFSEESLFYFIVLTAFFAVLLWLLWFDYELLFGLWPTIVLTIIMVILYLNAYIFFRDPKSDEPIHKWFK